LRADIPRFCRTQRFFYLFIYLFIFLFSFLSSQAYLSAPPCWSTASSPPPGLVLAEEQSEDEVGLNGGWLGGVRERLVRLPIPLQALLHPMSRTPGRLESDFDTDGDYCHLCHAHSETLS
jgi:hypothetical protein